MPRDRSWGEEIMAIEPTAMRGFDRPLTRNKGARSEVGGVCIEWDDVLARMGSVALIRIEGPLSRCGDWWSMGYDDILEAHDNAFRSDARAVLQVHHSPGGYISGLDETAMQLEEMARKAGKPLHALSADMMYSAAVRIACAAQKRWIVRAGGIGSVGVIVSRADWTKANEMMGLRIDQITSGEYKADGSPDVAITKAEIERIKGRVDHHAGLFFDAVEKACGPLSDEVKKAALFLGPAAVTAKLADGVSTLAECVARLEQETSGRPMVAVPAGPRGQQSQTARGRSMDNAMLAVALGKVSASASDQDITERASALKGLEDGCARLTGKADPAASLAVIEGWKESAAQLKTAQDELAKVAAREEASAFAALVTQGELSAQITPGRKADVLARFPTSAQLKAYLEVAPTALPGQATAADKPGAPPAPPVTGDGPPKFKGKAYAELTFAERAAWNKEEPASWAVAKADYDRSKGG